MAAEEGIVSGKSDMDTSEEQESDINPDVRTRNPTEKGREWQLTQLGKHFKSMYSQWRKQSSHISVLLSDCKDCDMIRHERNQLQECINRLQAYLDEMLELDEHCPLADKFESVANDHQTLLYRIVDTLKDLESDKESVRSNRTFKSAHSGSSSRSSQLSTSSRVSAQAQAASLKAKLKYIDSEARSRAELERVQTLKQIEMAEAKIEAIEASDPFLSGIKESYVKNIPSASSTELVHDFVKSHTETASLKLPVPSPTSLQPSIPASTINSQDVSVTPSNSDSSTSAVVTSSLTPIVNSSLRAPDHTIAQTTSSLSAAAPTFVPTTTVTLPTVPVSGSPDVQTINHSILELTKSLVDQVSLNRLPPPEPGIFCGDPIQYPAWKAAFKTLIEQRNIPPSESIHYLKKYLGSPVRQVVENYFLLTTDDAYEDAKRLLDERYGDPFVIASAFRDRLDTWPKVNQRDPPSLLKFSDFLKQCLTAMQSCTSLSILNDERENRKMLTKLPDWLVNRWNRIVASKRDENKSFPPFSDFVEFVKKEAKIAMDPVTSVHSIKISSSEGVEKTVKSTKWLENKDRRSRSFASRSGETPGNVPKLPVIKKFKGCHLCQKNHELDNCYKFLGWTLSERKSFAKDNGLCFGCLHVGHISKHCRQRKKCNVCSKYHPSSLHGDVIQHDKRESTNERKPLKQTEVENTKFDQTAHTGSAFRRDSSCSKCSMILPVYVSHVDDPLKERLVYALLDTQSDSTFILGNTCKALGVTGVDVKLSLSTMHAENKVVSSKRVKGLIVRGYGGTVSISLPDTYTRDIMPADRSHIPTPEKLRQWPHLEPICNFLSPMHEVEIGLLIGYDCPQALTPRDVVTSVDNGPFAQKTDLGWGVVGVVKQHHSCDDPIGVSNRLLSCEIPADLSLDSEDKHYALLSLRTTVKEVVCDDVLQLLRRDFADTDVSGPLQSQEDSRFLALVSDGIHFKDGHYEMPLPFKDPMPDLPNNKAMALNRLKPLRKRLLMDDTYRTHYFEFMRELIRNGHAERVTHEATESVWYIPHHGVYHPHKPGKIRVVFDCSAVFNNDSLNAHLLQGPDLTNGLIGVLCRFRKEPIAIMCDIEKMFYQFKVTTCHRDYLRFLWWEGEDLEQDPVEFRMTVHLFGAKSSPGCANFGLKRLAQDHRTEFGVETSDFITHDFYVDDGLKSVGSVDGAVSLIENSKAMCAKASLRLHKYVSNVREVIKHLKPEDLAQDLKTVDLSNDKLPVERALGVYWCTDSDTFQFRPVVKNCPTTRRGLLSIVSSVYDPLGFIAPVVLTGKQILQQMCADRAEWDDPLPEPLLHKFHCWYRDLDNLHMLQLPRCVKPDNFGEITVAEAHHFSDASSYGYGQCSYLRLINAEGQVHCSLLIGKSRVVPLKPITIPRLELSAALVSVKVSCLLDKELGYENLSHFYWTDSRIVLGYISNEARRFHVFVANRVQQIREHTNPSQWRYVASEDNPADIASRGSSVVDLISDSKWLRGPDLLWANEILEPDDEIACLESNDPELKCSQVVSVQSKAACSHSVLEHLSYFSDWYRAKRAVALCLRLKEKLYNRSVKRPCFVLSAENRKSHLVGFQTVTVAELNRAEIAIVKLVQSKYFEEEIETLNRQDVVGFPLGRDEQVRRHKVLKDKSHLCKLDPFLDIQGIVRVGGRLQNADMLDMVKHPVVLPKECHVTNLIVRHFHNKVLHQGRGITMNEIRSNGFWIIGCNSVVSSSISKCVTCRRLRSLSQGQKRSDLPKDRLEPVPPFTYCAVDYFGPWYIKEGRKELKRYGVLFTCLACRAVHVETSNSLSTDSFINCLRRFIAIRGPLRLLRSDRGTNFVGAERELREAVMELDQEQIQQFLLKEGCDTFEFKMNVPSASHMGGVWERQIRSVRNVLATLLCKHGQQLDDESFRTFMCETSAIVNSRPLTTENLNDPLSLAPLTPNHLLTMKSKVVLPPPGNFQHADLYSRKRWRRVQHLVNEFWSRWKLEFLQNLQVRNKWTRPRRNMMVGDIVILKDENEPRNQWKLGRIDTANKDEDGLVRKVRVTMSSNLNNKGERHVPVVHLERPIHKLVLLKETEEIPIEEPVNILT